MERFAVNLLKSGGAAGIKPMDSAVLFSSDKELKAPWAVNMFRVIITFRSKDIQDAVHTIARGNWKPVHEGHGSFRIIVMDRGKLRSIPDSLMAAMERRFTMSTGMHPNRAKPDIEVWLNRRNDGLTFFMLRADRRGEHGPKLNKGELRRDIACIMLCAAELPYNSVLADPFGGWGSIAAAAVESGRLKMIYTGDINPVTAQYQQKRFKNTARCKVATWDATALPFDNQMLDAIVTDPPWGEFADVNTKKLYGGFIKEAARVLRPDGKLVFLSSAREDAMNALKANNFIFNITPTKIGGKDTFLFVAFSRINDVRFGNK